jgi:predicted PhzF superfamily epimerase YddE/YHI9
MGLEITHVDSFTDKPFAGNPAAVCILESAARSAWMQLVAREMNLSETAFLVKRGTATICAGSRPWSRWIYAATRRWRAPTCSGSRGISNLNEAACFHTKSGVLTAKKEGTWIEMDFPATPAKSPIPLSRLAKMDSALG